MLCLKKANFWQKILETKHKLLRNEKKELTENEMKQYFSFFKDVATSVENITCSQKGHFVSLFEKLENPVFKGDQLKGLFDCLVEKSQKQQKPNWREKRSVEHTPSLLHSREFYELLAHGFYNSYENRLYLGGPCNAGKTSLACILTGDEVPDKWISTNGLQIYFGQNGIHLKDKKMIPIRKGMLCHTVHGKVITAINDIEKKDMPLNPKSNRAESNMVNRVENEEVNRAEKKETVPTESHESGVEGSCNKEKFQDHYELEKLHFDYERYWWEQTTTITDSTSGSKNESSGSTKTLNVVQEETLRKTILDEIRNGEYNLEIAPSDLVDFGGQKAFDMTHQLFILQEGTVLLLFDGSKDLNDPLPEYHGKIITSAEILLHWVDSVSTYCTKESVMHRIQFVATHSDRYQDNFENRRKELLTQLAATFIDHEQKSYLCFDNLFFIDARNKEDNEIDQLKDELVRIAFTQTSWGQKMPLIWVPLEKQIVDLKLRGTTILRIEEIQSLNKSNEDLMMDDEKLNFFLRTQHAMGKFIFFDQDELSKFVIIEPSVLVNALRSFVTDEMFFPTNDKECYQILKDLQMNGILRKNDLMKLWNQDQFRAIFQNQDYKEYMLRILLRLDVLVEPILWNQDHVNYSPDYYIVPCMIQTRLDNDYAEKYLNKNRSICMAYVFKEKTVPPYILFQVIASAVGIWPLKEYQKRKMFFQDIATFIFDENNEFSLIKEGNKIVVYFTNANSIQEIQPPKVAGVQECLSMAMESIAEFYQLHSRRINASDITELKQFELEHGAACKTPCFIKREEEQRLSKAGMWICEHGQSHKTDYLWYWDSMKSKEHPQNSFTIADISPTVLMLKPPADLLRKVSFAVGIDGVKLGLHLGIESSVIEKMVIGNRYNIFEKTLKILDYWEMLGDPVTIKYLVDKLKNVGGRGLATIVEYYSSSNKPFRRGRSKSIPLVLLTQDGMTEDKGINVLHIPEIFCDGFLVDCIADKRINMRAQTVKDDCKNRLIDYESLLNRHILLQHRINNRQFDFNNIAEELTVAIQHKDSLLFRHILAYWNFLKSDIKVLKQLLVLSIENQCGCCAKAVAWKISRLFLKEVSVTECCDIWPGFRCTCKKSNTRHGGDSIYFCSPEVVIIVEVSAKANQCEPKSFYGIPIRYEKQISNSQEGKLITEKIATSQDEDSKWVSKVTGISDSRAKHYFAQHRKLSVISPSPIKSKGYPLKQDCIKRPCIQLYCRLKGYIPVGEAHYPSEIDGIPTDILQGYAEMLVEDIRIGSQVGRLGGGTGTLGGFVRYLGKDAFLTCAHVIINKNNLVTRENRKKIHENPITVNYTNQGPDPSVVCECGELIAFAFPPDNSDGVHVDAAIIQMDKDRVKINNDIILLDGNRTPMAIKDIGMSSPYLNECYLDYTDVGTDFQLITRSCGFVSGLQERTDKVRKEGDRSIKFDALTESVRQMLIQNPRPPNVSEQVHFVEQVQKVEDAEFKSPSRILVCNQISFRNVDFEPGDSGTCIYVLGPVGKSGCIGMAIASHPGGGCIVTPIKAILSALRIL